MNSIAESSLQSSSKLNLLLSLVLCSMVIGLSSTSNITYSNDIVKDCNSYWNTNKKIKSSAILIGLKNYNDSYFSMNIENTSNTLES